MGLGSAPASVLNSPPIPAIQWVVDNTTGATSVPVSSSGYLAIGGVALTGEGISPTPSISLHPTFNGSPDNGVTLNFYSSAVTNLTTDQAQVDVSYTIGPNAIEGPHTLSLTTAGGTAYGTFWVFAQPSITSVSPSVFPASASSSQNYPVTITGTNLGTSAGSVTFPGLTVQWAPGMWNNTTITGTLTVPTNTPSQNGAVTVAPGVYGSGFVAPPGKSGTATKSPLTVTGAPPPTSISISGPTEHGGLVTVSNCAVISAGDSTNPPTMPALSYTLQNPPAGSGTVSWHLVLRDFYNTFDGSRDWNRDYGVGGSQQLWQGFGVMGGAATITATYTGGSVTGAFCIKGTNPFRADILTFLNHGLPGYLWAEPFMIQQESSFLQYTGGMYGTPRTDGSPAWGYGLMQITNPVATVDDRWNWQINITTGTNLLLKLEASADTFWASSISNAVTSSIAIGLDREGSCTFDPNIVGRTLSGVSHGYADAILLKKYNSANTGHDYIQFNVPVLPPSVLPPPDGTCNPAVTSCNWRQNGVSPVSVWSQPADGPPAWTAPAPPASNMWYVSRYAKNATNYVQTVCLNGN